LQRKIADRIETRYTPRLTFVLDKGVKNSLQVARILREVLPPAASAEPAEREESEEQETLPTGAACAEEAAAGPPGSPAGKRPAAAPPGAAGAVLGSWTASASSPDAAASPEVPHVAPSIKGEPDPHRR